MGRNKRNRKSRSTKAAEAAEKKDAFSSLGGKGTLAIILAVLVMLSAMGGWWYFNYGRTDGSYLQYIDRTITFPRDEGKHSELMETWNLVLHLRGNMGDSISIHVSYNYFQTNMTRTASVSDPSGLTGKNYFASVAEGTLASSYEGLDISWNRGQESDSLKAIKGLAEGDPGSAYAYSMEYKEDATDILSVNCIIYNQKSPVLYGSIGKMYFYDLGTLYGYFLPRLTVRGNVTLIDGTVMSVEGMGWMEHTWGYYLISDLEVMHIQLRNGVDLRLIRAYAPKSPTPGLEYYYYIRTDGSFDVTQWQPEEAASLSVMTDGRYSSIETVEYHFYPLDFAKAPWGSNRSAFGTNWRFTSGFHGIDILLDATIDSQFSVSGNWRGSLLPRDNLGYLGRAYAIMSHSYNSDPLIQNVRNNRPTLELPMDPTEVKANITNGVPYEHIFLVYSVDGGNEIAVGMSPVEMEINVWKGVIPGQRLFSVVEYRIEVLDLAGSMAQTDWESYTVRV